MTSVPLTSIEALLIGSVPIWFWPVGPLMTTMRNVPEGSQAAKLSDAVTGVPVCRVYCFVKTAWKLCAATGETCPPRRSVNTTIPTALKPVFMRCPDPQEACRGRDGRLNQGLVERCGLALPGNLARVPRNLGSRLTSP